MSGHARPATTSQRHLLFALVAATAIGASGLAAGGNASALLAIDLVGTDAVAGLPMLLLVLGSALGALVLVPLAAAFGRARALSGGYLLGGCGALTTVLAATGGGFVVLERQRSTTSRSRARHGGAGRASEWPGPHTGRHSGGH